MNESKTPGPPALKAADVPARTKPSVYPEPFASRMSGREKRALGDQFGLTNLGVKLTKLQPGCESALLHRHTKQDEFVFVLEGEPTLVTESGETQLCPGMCAGFPADGVAHHLVNRTEREVVILEVGDRSAGDAATYPADDLQATLHPSDGWKFTRKDGTAY